jgi:predicted AlkP superfamily pyrophosphatase or phosphodiesterase
MCFHKLKALLALFVLSFSPSLYSEASVSWQASEIVILISMDGMRYDYPDKADFPAFKRMEQEGLRAEKLMPVFPSNTFPGHVSLATGAKPETHGIIDNKFYDKKLRKRFRKEEAAQWIEAEPLWITTLRQGKRSAVYYWLGSEGQWQDKNATYFKSPFKSTDSERAKVKEIVRWIDLPLEKRPHLIMSYWLGADTVGHKLGPDSAELIPQIQKQDKYLGKLIKAIDERKAWSHITLLVVSDHGMTKGGKNIDLRKLNEDGGFEGYYQKSSAVAHLNLKKGFSIKQAYRFLKKQKQFDVYYPQNMPRTIRVNHPSRSGDLVLVAKTGYRFSAAGFYKEENIKSGDKSKLPEKLGMHGMHASHPDMPAIFFAMGRGIKLGSKLKRVEMIDVAPSVTELLNIEAPLHAEGRAFLPNLK